MPYNPRLMIGVASDFIWAADACMEPIGEVPGGNPAESRRVVPAITNAAFAAELSLKAMLVVRGITVPAWHRLRELYALVPNELQAAIKEKLRTRMKVTDAEFNKGLNDTSDAFTEWRYVFEVQATNPLDYKFRSEFALAACNLGRELV